LAYITSFKNQNYLLPLNITDLFSEDHVCYLIEQIAEQLDYSEFDKKYAGAGHPAYHPRINIKLLLMANVDGIRSSRRIAKNARENVVYIYLAEKTSPDFRTISDFRKDNRELIKNVFREVNMFALEHGLIDLSHLMIDGTTIKANANNQRILDKETLRKLDEYIDKSIEEGIKVDEEEDKIYGERSMHELPEEFNDSERRKPIVRKIVNEINKSIKEGKKEHVKQIKQAFNSLQQMMHEQGLKKYGLTDSDARFMLNKKGGKELSYNAQLVVERNGLIISNDVVQECDDRNQLVRNVNHVEQEFGTLSKKTKVIVDNGYENGVEMENLDKRGFDLYIPGKNMKEGGKTKRFVKANFRYDEVTDRYICPEGKILKNVGTSFNKKRGVYMTIYKGIDCPACPHRKECCKNSKFRTIHALPQDKLFNQIRKKLSTREGKAIYDLRKQTVERSIGDIKHNKKFRSFLLRGKQKVKVEFNLACIAHNLVIINNKLWEKHITSTRVNGRKGILDILAVGC